MWFLFTVAFSCYLRVEINAQLIRNEFNDKHNKWNKSLAEDLKRWNEDRTLDLKRWNESTTSDFYAEQNGNISSDIYAVLREDNNVPECVTMYSKTQRGEHLYKEDQSSKFTRILTTREIVQKMALHNPMICHPHVGDWLPQDSSKMVLLSLLVLSAMAWMVFLLKTCRDQWPIRTSTLSALLPVCLNKKNTAKNVEKDTFKDCVNLLTITTVIIMMLICFLTDCRNLKHEPATPFFDFDGGFLFMEIILLLLALYFVVNFFHEIRAHCSQLIDPSSSFQLVSSLAAIVTLLRKNYLTTAGNGGQGPATGAGAIGITLAYLCLILKYGRYDFTTIGNFATMFHIILRKLRSYMVVAFVLLFGFSFGFWVIKQHDCKSTDAHFEGFLTSIKSCFVMFFGGFDNYENILELDEEIEKGHHLTLAAFYVLFLMMIVVTSLGMLNLLLAAIISDYKKNMKEVHMQNLISMAQYLVLLEQCTRIKNLLVNQLGIKSVEKWARLDEKVETYTYCTLDLCYMENDNQDHIHPEEEFRNIINNRRK